MFLAGRFGIAAQRFAMAGQPWTDMILSVGMERPGHAGAPGEDGESSRGRLLVPSLYGLAEEWLSPRTPTGCLRCDAAPSRI